MRPAEISRESIIEAGQDLQAGGRNITGFALRQRVGGGNPTRLKQVWDEYISSQAEARAEPVVELPVEVAEEVEAVSKALSERISQLATALNDKAVKAAERRVAEVVRAAGDQREQAERELADASQTVEDLESKLDTTETERLDLEKAHGELREQHQAQAVELAQVRERLAAAEQDAYRVADRLAKAEADRDTAREEAAKLRGQVEALQVQNAELMRALTTRQN